MELNRKLNPLFQDARIPTEHPLLIHVKAIAYSCKSNCLFMYKQRTQRVTPGRTGKGDRTTKRCRRHQTKVASHFKPFTIYK